jgi:hypothetical protein
LAISKAREIGAEHSGTAVSLLFAAGRRPGSEAIRQLAERQGGFSVSFDPSVEAEGGGGPANEVAPPYAAEPIWLELLANGLTFDLSGLAEGAPDRPPPCIHGFALPPQAEPLAMEAVTLRPGPHLAGGHALLPIVRSLAWLAATLAQIDGTEAVAWHAARSWCGRDYFRSGVLSWVEGGVFPGLGLTALATGADGGMQSEGLALFTGQELRIEPEVMQDPAEGAKLGLRMIDWLVASGRIEARQTIVGPDGQPLRVEPSANGRFVRVWRG